MEDFKDVSPKDKNHMTPLHFATLVDGFDLCKLIIEKSKGVDSTTSHLVNMHFIFLPIMVDLICVK